MVAVLQPFALPQGRLLQCNYHQSDIRPTGLSIAVRTAVEPLAAPQIHGATAYLCLHAVTQELRCIKDVLVVRAAVARQQRQDMEFTSTENHI